MANYELVKDGTSVYAKVPLDDLEDMEDAIEAAAIHGRILRGEEEAFPSDLVYSIIDGVSPIRAYRKYRGMTQIKLAEASHLKQPAIARAEKGGATSVSALQAISKALNVDIEMLLSPEG